MKVTIDLPAPVTTARLLRSLDCLEDYLAPERDHWVEAGRPAHHAHVYASDLMLLRDAIRGGLGIDVEAAAPAGNVTSMASYSKDR